MRTILTAFLAAGAMLLFAEGWVVGRAARAFSEDGPGWRAVSQEGRLLYVDGYHAGYRAGDVDELGRWTDAVGVSVLKHQITEKQFEEINNTLKEQERPHQDDSWTGKMGWTGWTAMKVTNGEIEDGMDRFYANPANQAICWGDAFATVSRSIAGQTFSEADMAALRGASVKYGCE